MGDEGSEMIEALLCPSCGAPRPEGAAFCISCGTKLTDLVVPATEAMHRSPDEPATEPTRVEAKPPPDGPHGPEPLRIVETPPEAWAASFGGSADAGPPSRSAGEDAPAHVTGIGATVEPAEGMFRNPLARVDRSGVGADVKVSTTPFWPAKAAVVVLIGVGIVIAVILLTKVADPKAAALSLVSMACSQAATWDQDIEDGSRQASVDQAAFEQTVEQLTAKLSGLPISSAAASELSTLQSMSAGLFGYGASSECLMLQGQLRTDLSP